MVLKTERSKNWDFSLHLPGLKFHRRNCDVTTFSLAGVSNISFISPTNPELKPRSCPADGRTSHTGISSGSKLGTVMRKVHLKHSCVYTVLKLPRPLLHCLPQRRGWIVKIPGQVREIDDSKRDYLWQAGPWWGPAWLSYSQGPRFFCIQVILSKVHTFASPELSTWVGIIQMDKIQLYHP